MDCVGTVVLTAGTAAASEGFVVAKGVAGSRIEAADGGVVHSALTGGRNLLRDCLGEGPEHQIDDPLAGFDVAARHCCREVGIDDGSWLGQKG